MPKTQSNLPNRQIAFRASPCDKLRMKTSLPLAAAALAALVLGGCKSVPSAQDDATQRAPEKSGSLEASAKTGRTLPALFIVGDSTVHNTRGLVGWGDVIGRYFDTNKIVVENHALGGRSSRTFQTQGWWDKVLVSARAGDFVLIQLGHNDSSPINDTNRSRGTIRGLGDETTNIVNGITHQPETVHTYGWYMRKYISDARAKKMSPILCSPVPRLPQPGKESDTTRYAGLARELAAQQNVPFIELNRLVLDRYSGMTSAEIRTNYFTPQDSTHFNPAGAELNAVCVIEGLRALTNCPLKKFLVAKPPD